MKLAIFGASIVSAYWNGAATYYRGVCRALHARGHHVRFVEQDIFSRQQHRDFPDDPDYCEVRVVSGWAALERELMAACREADLVVKCNDTGANDREMEEWLTGAGKRAHASTPVAFWDVDAPATLAECAAPDCYLRPLIPRFACIFTYGGGAPVREGYHAIGAQRVVPVYNAVDPDAYQPAPASLKYACDLLFMGNRMPDREARVQAFFLDAAASLPHAQFVLGGAGWGDLPLPPNVRYIGYCPTPLHPVLNGSARLVLNVTREAMAISGYSPATRVFEAAACGACLVTDAWEGIEHFFEPEEEILVAHGPEDVTRFLTEVSATRAQTIGARARGRALRDHSYGSRAAVFEVAAAQLVGGLTAE